MPTSARPRALRHRVRALAGTLLAAATVLLTAPTATAATPAPTADDVAAAPVVLVGVTGLRWDDVTTLTTPTLWDLSRDGSIGLVAARSVASRSCPADGWLAVS